MHAKIRLASMVNRSAWKEWMGGFMWEQDFSQSGSGEWGQEETRRGRNKKALGLGKDQNMGALWEQKDK